MLVQRSGGRRIRAILAIGVTLAVLPLWATSASAADDQVLVFGATSDRAGQAALAGGTLSGNAYIAVTPDAGIKEVRFYLDDPTRAGAPRHIEKTAPWDFVGSAVNGSALPFDTTTLSNGSHTITATMYRVTTGTFTRSATFTVTNGAATMSWTPGSLSFTVAPGGSAGGSASLSAGAAGPESFTATSGASWASITPATGTTPVAATVAVNATGLAAGTYTTQITATTATASAPLSISLTVGAPPPAGYSLVHSASPSRTAPAVLNGATISGPLYAFVTPESGISQARWYLDDAARANPPRFTEKSAPWDFAGGNADGTAKSFNTTTLLDGVHSITVVLSKSAGGTVVITATFTVDNGNEGLRWTPASLALTSDVGETVTGVAELSTATSVSTPFTVSTSASWVTLTPSTGTTPSTVSVSANTIGKSPGVYNVPVTASSGSFDTEILNVKVTVGDTQGCEPIACQLIKVETPYNINWRYDANKILDQTGTGTGFTTVLKPPVGTGFDAAKLDVDLNAGELRITSAPGAFSTNTQLNALGVGFDGPDQVTVLTATLPALPTMTKTYEQAGLWFGTDQDNVVKLDVVSTATGTRIEQLVEVAGAATSKTQSGVLTTGSLPVTLSMSADPVTKKVTGSYKVGSAARVTLATHTVPGDWFSFDAAGIDPRIGTRSFGGIYTSQRNATTPRVFRFSEFSVGGMADVIETPGFAFTRKSHVLEFPTAMAYGPDNRVYVTTLMGQIHALTYDAAKNVTDDTVIDIGGGRLSLGIAIDPASTPTNVILWVNHSSGVQTSGVVDSGIVSKLSGPGFATRQDVITGLPRSFANHATNAIHFGPDGKLYLAQGGNTGAGAANTANTEFGDRGEQALSAALLVADVKAAGFDGSCQNVADMYGATPCDVTVFASGLRNMYDFVFHSNGQIYGPTNGLGVVGSYPSSPTAPCPGLASTALYNNGGNNPGAQPDQLNRITQGSYYGHPNQARNECVFRDGRYQGVPALPNYKAPFLDLGDDKSADGTIEYTGDAFCGSLKNQILIANYSVGDNITRVKPSADGLTALESEPVVGGFKDPLPLLAGPDGEIYVGEFGGAKVTVLLPEDTGCWTSKPALPASLLDVGGTAIGSKVYVVGGKTPAGPVATPYIYDTVANSWSAAAAMPVPVENPAVATVGGKLYAFGGASAPFTGAVTASRVYDPATNSWAALAAMPTARGGAAAAVIGTKVYVMGGMNGAGASLATVEIYDTATNTWAAGPAMSTARDNPGGVALGGKLYVFGGRTRLANGTTVNGTLNTVEMLDPATIAWVARAAMPTGRRTGMTVVLGGRAIVMGGEITGSGAAFAANEEYNPVTDSWRQLRPMATPRHGGMAGVVAGKVHVVAGGTIGGASYSNVHEVFAFGP